MADSPNFEQINNFYSPVNDENSKISKDIGKIVQNENMEIEGNLTHKKSTNFTSEKNEDILNNQKLEGKNSKKKQKKYTNKNINRGNSNLKNEKNKEVTNEKNKSNNKKYEYKTIKNKLENFSNEVLNEISKINGQNPSFERISLFSSYENYKNENYKENKFNFNENNIQNKKSILEMNNSLNKSNNQNNCQLKLNRQNNNLFENVMKKEFPNIDFYSMSSINFINLEFYNNFEGDIDDLVNNEKDLNDEDRINDEFHQFEFEGNYSKRKKFE